MNRVIFDMKNQNSLISLAYIKVSDNPLRVFCNYILYLLMKEPGHAMRVDLLKDQLLQEFGLSMPQQLINNCIRILQKQGEVTRLDHGAGYRVADTKFDIDAFEKKRMQLHEHEEALLKSLIEFVSERYKKTWSKDDARQNLSYFLDKEGYGAQLFLQKSLEIEGRKISPSLYIGRYIDFIQKQPDAIERTYLEEVVNGMMVLQGIRQTEDYQQNKQQKFKGTVFYLDTKLVLRALGFSWKAQVDSVREMVRLLRDKYEARIGIFPQTLTEVENALSAAGNAIKNHRPVRDLELKLYSELYPEEASMMLDYLSSLKGLLKRELGIDETTTMDWNSSDAQRYHIDTKAIADYIEQKCGWKRGSVDYDVEIINQINILRKADYTQPYGSKSRLPVFVTSNSKLAYTFRDYINESEENGKGWSSHALPVISDNMLLYRVWLPFATEFSDLPALTLSRFAYSAQSEGIVFFEEFRKVAAGLDRTRNVDLISTTEATRRKLEDILIRETDGELDQLTSEVVATSFEECVRMEHIDLVEENKDLSERVGTRESQVIQLLAKDYVDKLGWLRILLFASKYWWLLGFGVLFAVTSAISENVYFRSISAIPILIQLVQFAIDKYIDDRGLRFCVYDKTLAFVKRRYIKKISAGLENAGYASDKDAVVKYCLSHTAVLNETRTF